MLILHHLTEEGSGRGGFALYTGSTVTLRGWSSLFRVDGSINAVTMRVLCVSIAIFCCGPEASPLSSMVHHSFPYNGRPGLARCMHPPPPAHTWSRFLDAARALEREAGPSVKKYEVCDNVDLSTVVQVCLSLAHGKGILLSSVCVCVGGGG